VILALRRTEPPAPVQPQQKSSGEFPMSDEVLKLIKDKEVQFVDLRFNDLRGKMQHVTFDVSMIDKDIFTEGTMFDGSSISGWKAINESDMVMRPDPAGAHIDPFYQQTTLAMFCDILEPGTTVSNDADGNGRTVASP
jgi:glutamine synthetase